MNSTMIILFFEIFIFQCNCKSNFFQIKISWFSSLKKADFSYQMIIWTWSISSCWFQVLSIMYLITYNLSKTAEKFILKCLMSLLHYIFTSSLCFISSFSLKLSSCIYHCRAISQKHSNKLILTVLVSWNSITFWIQLQKKWIFWMRIFFLLNMTSFLL